MRSDELLESIGMIDDSLIADAKPVRRGTKINIRKFSLIAAALLLCITIAVPVMAVYVPGTYEILYAISPVIAQKLKPVQRSCEDNGIRMEVLSASIEGDTAQIYIALQDLEGDRIDATTDLFDSYQINRPFDCSATCQMVSYEEKTKTATFLLSITQWEGKQIEGSKLTFLVNCFLSGKEHVTGLLPEVDLSKVNLTPETQTVRSFRGSDNFPEMRDLETASFLAPNPDSIASPADGVTITAVGYIDGNLHVQVYYEDILHTDNHGFLYLVDEAGAVVAPSYTVSFWDQAQYGSYDEAIFDISPDALSNYMLYGEFWTCDTLTKGDWQVTFPLPSEQSES